MLEAPPRRRALRDEVAYKRQALAALTPIHEQIGPWQTQTARLHAYAEKLRSIGSYEPTIVAEAEALFSAVSRQQRMLLETTQDLPPEVAANSRFLDTARALKSVASSLETTLTLLQRR
jgi:hypothetical protein